MLAAAVALPTFAAQAEWNLGGFAPEEREAVDTTPEIAPMVFETAEGNFPGSALYFLADPPAAIAPQSVDTSITTGIDPIAAWNGDPNAALDIHDAGPAARPFLASGTGMDRARALECLAKAVYYEAASESTGGQRAVAQVVLNRVSHPSYPKTVCGVVYQGSQRRTGCQFTFTCDGSLRRKASASHWNKALSVARAALSGEVYAPVGLATHYHTTWVNPYWAPSLDHIGTIGAHRFYRWKGAASRPEAFSVTYRGGEPASAAAAAARASAPAPDPVAVAEQYATQTGTTAQAGVSTAPSTATPAATGQAQSRANPAPSAPVDGPGSVKPEYARSGQWLTQPN